MPHEPYSLKKITTSIAIVCTALVLVGCGSSSSKSSMNSETPGFRSTGVLISENEFDVLTETLNFEGSVSFTRANLVDTGPKARFSRAVRFATANSIQTTANAGIIHHSTVIENNSSDGSAPNSARDTIDNLIVEVTNMTDGNDNLLYSINYLRHQINDKSMVHTEHTIPDTISNTADNIEHAMVVSTYIGNLKLSALSSESLGNGDYYLEIYTNYGEDDGNGGTFGESNYLAMGAWVYAGNAATDVGTFVHGADPLPASLRNTLDSAGDATYRGTAVGFIAVGASDAKFSPVMADVNLSVDFSDGSVSGMINNFAERGDPSDFSAITTSIGGQINLREGTAAAGLGGFLRSELTSGSTLMFNGASHTYVGHWSNQFYGLTLDDDGQPRRAAGTVAAEAGTTSTSLHLSFGANKQ